MKNAEEFSWEVRETNANQQFPTRRSKKELQTIWKRKVLKYQ